MVTVPTPLLPMTALPPAVIEPPVTETVPWLPLFWPTEKPAAVEMVPPLTVSFPTPLLPTVIFCALHAPPAEIVPVPWLPAFSPKMAPAPVVNEALLVTVSAPAAPPRLPEEPI
jgi:hypothetical protein